MLPAPSRARGSAPPEKCMCTLPLASSVMTPAASTFLTVSKTAERLAMGPDWVSKTMQLSPASMRRDAGPVNPVASVVTSPAGDTLRKARLAKSATSTWPRLFSASPPACLKPGAVKRKRAAPARLSMWPRMPGEPARVETRPSGVILRMTWLSVSST